MWFIDSLILALIIGWFLSMWQGAKDDVRGRDNGPLKRTYRHVDGSYFKE